jgi:hypothetical protein
MRSIRLMKTAILILAGVLATTTVDAMSVQETKPGDQALTGVVTVQGKVESYTTGKSITVMKKDGMTATFTIPAESRVPTDIAVGRKVTIRTRPNDPTLVETITIDKEKRPAVRSELERPGGGPSVSIQNIQPAKVL